MNKKTIRYRETIAKQGYLILKNEREANIAAKELEAQIKEGTVIGTRRGRQYYFAREDWYAQNEDASVEGDAARVVSAFYNALNHSATHSPTARKTATYVPPSALFFLDQHGNSFARVEIHGHHEVHAVRSKNCKRIIASWLIASGENATESAIRDTVAHCNGLSIMSGQIHALFNRYYRDETGVYIDLGGADWRVAHITTEGFRILNSAEISKPIFRRYSHFKEIRVAGEGTKEDFQAYLSLLNIKPADRVVYAGLLASAMIPGFPHFILLVDGSPGAAKSTLCRHTRRLIDNSDILLMPMSNKNDQLSMDLMHHYLPVFDNVSAIQEWQSDKLCRAVTGEGITKRELYSDDDDVIYKFMRVPMINGIDNPGGKSDLIDRLLAIHLDRIKESDRITEAELEHRFAPIEGRVVAYLYSIVSRALKNYAAVEAELKHKLKRQADAVAWGETCAREMGYPAMEFYEAVATKLSVEAREVVTGSTIGSLLLDWLEATAVGEDGFIKIKPDDCYGQLEALARSKGVNTKSRAFPRASHALTRKLNVMKPNLAELGWTFESVHSGRNTYLFGKIPSKASDRPPTDDKGLGRYLDASKLASSNSVRMDAIEVSATNTVHDTVHSSSDDNGRKDGMDGILPTSYTSSVNSREASPQGQDHSPSGDGAGSPQETSPPGQPTKSDNGFNSIEDLKHALAVHGLILGHDFEYAPEQYRAALRGMANTGIIFEPRAGSWMYVTNNRSEDTEDYA